MQNYDPHTSVTTMLTEIRAVLSRARRAQKLIGRPGGSDHGVTHPGPDLGEIRLAIAFVVQLLEPWERHGPGSPDGAPPDRP